MALSAGSDGPTAEPPVARWLLMGGLRSFIVSAGGSGSQQPCAGWHGICCVTAAGDRGVLRDADTCVGGYLNYRLAKDSIPCGISSVYVSIMRRLRHVTLLRIGAIAIARLAEYISAMCVSQRWSTRLRNTVFCHTPCGYTDLGSGPVAYTLDTCISNLGGVTGATC